MTRSTGALWTYVPEGARRRLRRRAPGAALDRPADPGASAPVGVPAVLGRADDLALRRPGRVHRAAPDGRARPARRREADGLPRRGRPGSGAALLPPRGRARRPPRAAA